MANAHVSHLPVDLGQAGLAFGPIVEGLGVKLGPALWLWPLALVSVARRPGLVAVGLGYSLIVLGWMALGVAAPHQQPYWLLTSLAVAGLWGAAPRLLLVGALLVSAAQLRPLIEDASGLWRRLEWDRGVDQALLGSRPGDALWLLAPGLDEGLGGLYAGEQGLTLLGGELVAHGEELVL